MTTHSDKPGSSGASTASAARITRGEAAELIGYSKAAFDKWAREGKGPSFETRADRTTWYDRDEVTEWARTLPPKSTACRNPAFVNHLLPKEAAELLGVSHQSVLSTWIKDGKGPPYHRDGRFVFYDREELLTWKATRLHNTHYENGRNKHRRLKSETEEFERALLNIVEEQYPMTVRQIYYQAVVRGLVKKTDQGYNDVELALVRMRKAFLGVVKDCIPLDPDWIVDGSRRIHDWQVFPSPDDAKSWLAEIYRKDVWADRDELVFLWMEKAALASILVDVCGEYAVPVIVASGFNSISHINRVAHIIEDADKPATIYYFRDRDPSGVWAPKALRELIDQLLPDAEITIETAAIDDWHVKEHGLEATAQETKRDGNSHYPEFAKLYGANAPSYELDALPPKVLRQIALECIQMHVSDDEHVEDRAAERDEQESLIDAPIDYAWDPMTDAMREAEQDRVFAEQDAVRKAKEAERDAENERIIAESDARRAREAEWSNRNKKVIYVEPDGTAHAWIADDDEDWLDEDEE
jgi:hypothetical protein